MNIARQVQKVIIRFDQRRFESTRKQVPDAVMPNVVVSSVTALQPLHAGAQVSPWRLHQEVVVVGKQRVCVETKRAFLNDTGQLIEEPKVIT